MRTLRLTTGVDASLEAEIDVPDQRPSAGLVTLHGASDGSKEQPIFRHTSALAGALGFAVLRFDRRPGRGLDDVPFRVQAEDALAACLSLKATAGDVPVGLWAFSQGAWPATRILADDAAPVAFGVLVGAAATTPSRQMRYAIREHVWRQGHDPTAATTLWATVESFWRGDVDWATAQAAIEKNADEPWFGLMGIPNRLPQEAGWDDADFDPRPLINQVRRPVLLVLGEQDEWVNTDETRTVWESSTAPVTTLTLRRAGHAPTNTGQPDGVPLDAYVDELRGWLVRLDTNIAGADDE